MATITQVPLDQITMLEELQLRAAIDVSALADYVEACKNKEPLPPVVLYQVPARGLLLVDGFHRVGAFAQAGLSWVPAEVREGSYQEAFDFALRANVKHGVRRTVADKRKATLAALRDPRYASQSDRAVGRAVGVSGPFVSTCRAELALAAAAQERARSPQEAPQEADPWDEEYERPVPARAANSASARGRRKKPTIAAAIRWLARARKIADARGLTRAVELMDQAALALDVQRSEG